MLEAEGYAVVRQAPHSAADVSQADVAIVAGSPEWARVLKDLMPTYFIDSLGFMWADVDKLDLEPVRDLTRYFAQDLFGSALRLRELGVRNVHPVSGIVEPWPVRSEGAMNDTVLSLGGVVNPFTDASVQTYINFVARIAEGETAKRRSVRVLMSKTATATFEWYGPGTPSSLSKSAMRRAMNTTVRFAASPGLTTLVEAASFGKLPVPLPPQNWSQVMICRQMAKICGEGLWAYLADLYGGLSSEMGETAGVAAVKQLNNTILRDETVSARICAYLDLPQSAASIRDKLGAPFSGAAECTTRILTDLGLR